MNTIKTNLWQFALTVIVAFIAGCFFKWHMWNLSLTTADLSLWLGACVAILMIVMAFFFGERRANALWQRALHTDETTAAKKLASFRAIATAAHGAIHRLDDRYQNTHEDRLRVRVVYQGEVFAGLIAALAAIPVHELETVEVVVALAGLRKTMIDAQGMIDLFIAAKNRRDDDVRWPESLKGIDLRACKAAAELHYQTLVRTTGFI
jgi:hypothetical protein